VKLNRAGDLTRHDGKGDSVVRTGGEAARLCHTVEAGGLLGEDVDTLVLWHARVSANPVKVDGDADSLQLEDGVEDGTHEQHVR
jgi:hypothetical protein